MKATGTLEDYRKLLRKEAKKYPQLKVVEGIHLVPHCLDFYVEDGLHPNELGFTQYAKNLLSEMKKLGNI